MRRSEMLRRFAQTEGGFNHISRKKVKKRLAFTRLL